MKIESYEPYHIGTKLNPYVNIDVLKEKLRKKLQDSGYQIAPPSPDLPLKIGAPVETLATKSGARIDLNYGAQALNVVALEPNSAFSVFQELMGMLPSLGYDISATALFQEIVATVIAHTDRKPLELLEKIHSLDVSSFKKFARLSLTTFRLASKDPENDDLVELVMEPSPSSPNDRLVIRILYRPKEKQKLKVFHSDLVDVLTKFLEHLEEGR